MKSFEIEVFVAPIIIFELEMIYKFSSLRYRNKISYISDKAVNDFLYA